MDTATEKYHQYLEEHIGAVKKAYKLLCENKIIEWDSETAQQIENHDSSKYCGDEWKGYLNKFYGEETKDKKIIEQRALDFKYAWNFHQKRNGHHPQYWCLSEDDNPEKLEALEMPINYVIEMVCDWWAFSITSNNLQEIQNWYKTKCKHILHPNTRKLVEETLERIKSIS